MRAKYILGGITFIVIATVCGVLLAIWVFKYFNIYIPLENQKVSIDLQEPLQAEVQILDALSVDVTGNIDASIPIKENLNIDVKQTLTPRVYFDNDVPIKTTIPVREILNVDQILPIDTKVKVKILGRDITLPLKGDIPIVLNVPIRMDIPLEQKVKMKFDVPIRADLKQNLIIPIDEVLDANIPIAGHLNVPIKTALKATVDVKNTLAVNIEKGEMVVPLKSLRLKQQDDHSAQDPKAQAAPASQIKE